MSTEYRPIFDFNDELVFHPVIYAIKKEGSKIESVEVGDTWRDDHCDCLNIDITIDGQKYQYSDWWLSQEGVRMYYHAESGKKKALNDLKKHLLLIADNV